jgi:hypothetical protein
MTQASRSTDLNTPRIYDSCHPIENSKIWELFNLLSAAKAVKTKQIKKKKSSITIHRSC